MFVYTEAAGATTASQIYLVVANVVIQLSTLVRKCLICEQLLYFIIGRKLHMTYPWFFVLLLGCIYY